MAEGASGGRLFSSLYQELHRAATRELRRNWVTTLGPTTLLHETFLNVSQRESAKFPDRPQFMLYAKRAMRGLVIDHLRQVNRKKRGREFKVVSLHDTANCEAKFDLQVERLREALEELAVLDQRLAQCVDLKFFGGLSFRDIAQLWKVSERTVLRDWDKARLLLNRLMRDAPTDSLQPP